MEKRMTDEDAKVSAWVVVIAMLLAILAILFAIIKPARGAETEYSFVISGYGVGEFAIKGESEKSLNAGIADVKTLAKTKKSDLQMQFVVIGSADVTGSSVGNDELASKRAEQVKAVLSANFPEAKISSWSRGDADNTKQVRVNYKIIMKPAPAPTPAPAPAPVAKDDFIFFPAGILVLLVITFIVAYFMTRKRATASKPEDARTGEATGIRWVEGQAENEPDGLKYFVPIEVRDGKFISPFMTLEDPTKPLFRSTSIHGSGWQPIKKAVRGCMSDPRYADKKAELIRRGVIKIK